MSLKNSPNLKKQLKKKSNLRETMLARMESARLRYLNDEMYNDKKNVLKSKAAFQAYHESFKRQQQLWESNPLDNVIKDLKAFYLKAGNQTEFVIADLGCGDAKIAEVFEKTRAKVHSIDFVATNKRVTACDMAHTNIPGLSVDVVVFCLSLMSSKCNDYIKEACRILKSSGRLLIAEVTSRVENVKVFTDILKEYGFTLYAKTFVSNEYFIYMKFNRSKMILPNPADIVLKPCKYKKR